MNDDSYNLYDKPLFNSMSSKIYLPKPMNLDDDYLKNEILNEDYDNNNDEEKKNDNNKTK